MQSKSCCITGHRKIDPTKIEMMKRELKNQIILALEDGYFHFISGFAEGVDLYFAEIVTDLQEQYPSITLEAVIPYRNRINCSEKRFKNLIAKCNSVVILSEKYSTNCFLMRNQFMVQSSSRVIVVYDGREKGGTVFTMRYARSRGKQVIVIKV